MVKPLNILGNLNNFNDNNPTIDMLFIALFLLDEYLETQIIEQDKKTLKLYSQKINKAIDTNDFSEITENFLEGLEKIINNLG